MSTKTTSKPRAKAQTEAAAPVVPSAPVEVAEPAAAQAAPAAPAVDIGPGTALCPRGVAPAEYKRWLWRQMTLRNRSVLAQLATIQLARRQQGAVRLVKCQSLEQREAVKAAITWLCQA